MDQFKLSYIVPSAATIVAAVITAYVSFLAVDIQSRDFGSLDEGQKLCVIAKIGKWHNITVVPKKWSVSMCSELGKSFDADAFHLGCSFNDQHVINHEANDLGSVATIENGQASLSVRRC